MSAKKPTVKAIYVRPDEETRERLVNEARDNRRSLNQQALTIIEAWFDPDSLRIRLAELEQRR